MLIGNVPKQPDEKFPVTADFAADMSLDGDSLTGVVTKVTRKQPQPEVDSSAAIKDGAPTISGTKVTQKVKLGADGETHRIEFEVTTTLGKILEAEIDLYVKEV